MIEKTSSYTTGFQELFSDDSSSSQRAIGFVKVISYCIIVIPIFYSLAQVIANHRAERRERKYVKINKALDAPAEKSKQAFQDKLLVPHLIEALKRNDGEHFKKGFPLLTPEGQMSFFEKVDEKQYITIFDLLKDQTEFHIRVRSRAYWNSNKDVELIRQLKEKNGSLDKLHLKFDYFYGVHSLLKKMQQNPNMILTTTYFGPPAVLHDISIVANALKLVKEIKDNNASLNYELEFDEFKVTNENITTGGYHYGDCKGIENFMNGRPLER